VETAGEVRWLTKKERSGADFRGRFRFDLGDRDIESEMTVAGWVRNRGVMRGGSPVAGRCGPDPGDRSFILYSTGGDGFGFRAFWSDGSQSNLTVFEAPTNTWFHIAGAYDGCALRLYLNGIEAARTVAVDRSLARGRGHVWVGGNGDPVAPPFAGSVDDVGVWSAALTASEIRELAASGEPLLREALEAFESFDGFPQSTSDETTFLLASSADDTVALAWFYSGNALRPEAQSRDPGFTFPQISGQRLIDEALWVSVLGGRFKAAGWLIGKGADINAPIGQGGSTSLHEAVAAKRFDAVQFAILNGADPTLEDPTHHAAAWEWAGHFDLPVVRAYLLDAASRTSLKAAVELGDLSSVEAILDKEPLPSLVLNEALGRAAHGGHTEIVDHLIRSVADLLFRDVQGRRAVDRAVRAGRYETVDLLRQKEGDLGDLPFRTLVSRLEEAIEDTNHVAASRLLGMDPGLVLSLNESGRTWLQRAADVDGAGLIRLFLNLGAPLEREEGEWTALAWAVSRGSLRAASVLVEAGARTDFWTSAGLGNLEELKNDWVDGALVEGAVTTGSIRRGPDGRNLSRPPQTPENVLSDALYIGAKNGHIEVVDWLLSCGADPNFRAERGGTPLYWAVRKGHVDVVRMLVEAGADPRIPDRYGRNALQAGRGTIQEVLREPSGGDR